MERAFIAAVVIKLKKILFFDNLLINHIWCIVLFSLFFLTSVCASVTKFITYSIDISNSLPISIPSGFSIVYGASSQITGSTVINAPCGDVIATIGVSGGTAALNELGIYQVSEIYHLELTAKSNIGNSQTVTDDAASQWTFTNSAPGSTSKFQFFPYVNLSTGEHSDNITVTVSNLEVTVTTIEPIPPGDSMSATINILWGVNGNFTVIPPEPVSITITNPNGDEELKGGTIHNITWTFSKSGIHHVHLLYSTDSGVTYQDITNNTECDGVYEWYPVPSVNSNKVRVKIIAKDLNNAIIAEDSSNGDFQIDNTVPSAQLELHLYKGWNLISICLDTGETNLLSVLKPIEGLYKSVWTYDTNLGWRRYISNSPDSLNDLVSIVPGKGYWLEMVAEAMLTITGLSIPGIIQLHEGLNLVGYTSMESQNIESALASISGQYFSIWTYDSLARIWWGYKAGMPIPKHIIGQIEPGRGYYISAKENCQWFYLK